MKPWDRQKEVQKETLQVPDIHYIIDIAQTIPNERLKALYVLLYLTGARICELVRKRGCNLIPFPENKITGKITKKYRYTKVLDDEKDKPSIRKKELTFQVMNEREVMVVWLRNEKNEKKDTKSVPIPLDNKEYAILIGMIQEYISKLNMEDELFPFGYQYAYRLLKPYFNPHWFRHIRATHLTLNNDLSAPLLRKYMGWTDDRPSAHYQEMKIGDILDRL